MAKHNFETCFQKAQMWEKFSVVSSWLGILDLILLIILFFYAKSIISTLTIIIITLMSMIVLLTINHP